MRKIVRILTWPVRRLLVRPAKKAYRTAKLAAELIHAINLGLRIVSGREAMTVSKAFEVLRAVYVYIIRPLIVDKIRESPQEWDNLVLDMLDRLFLYREDTANA